MPDLYTEELLCQIPLYGHIDPYQNPMSDTPPPGFTLTGALLSMVTQCGNHGNPLDIIEELPMCPRASWFCTWVGGFSSICQR